MAARDGNFRVALNQAENSSRSRASRARSMCSTAVRYTSISWRYGSAIPTGCASRRIRDTSRSGNWRRAATRWCCSIPMMTSGCEQFANKVARCDDRSSPRSAARSLEFSVASAPSTAHGVGAGACELHSFPESVLSDHLRKRRAADVACAEKQDMERRRVVVLFSLVIRHRPCTWQPTQRTL